MPDATEVRVTPWIENGPLTYRIWNRRTEFGMSVRHEFRREDDREPTLGLWLPIPGMAWSVGAVAVAG